MTKIDVGDSFEVIVPTEPPHKAVVLDRNELAWQNIQGQWIRNGAVVMLFVRAEGSLRWDELLIKHGPATLIHAGVQPVDEAPS